MSANVITPIEDQAAGKLLPADQTPARMGAPARGDGPEASLSVSVLLASVESSARLDLKTAMMGMESHIEVMSVRL